MDEMLYQRVVDYIIENQNKFYRLAYSYVKNKEDALDVVQDAVCIGLDKYTSLKNTDAVKTWFYRILVNESLRVLRRRDRLVLTEDQADLEMPYYEKGYEVSDDICQQINMLEEDTQKIVKLRFYEEFSLQEIAETLEMNLNTVKAKLYRGLKQLKENMKEEDVWED